MKHFLYFLFVISCYPQLVLSQTIITIAGGAVSDVLEDGPATSVALSNPYGLVIDTLGNIFFADRNNHALRLIDTHGNLSTIAGTGKPGYNGDGKRAIKAKMDYPICVAFDNLGNLLFSDRYNNCIRKISPAQNGIITKIAGTGSAGYSGEGSAATDAQLNGPGGIVTDELGNLIFCDAHNHCIRKIASSGVIRTIAGTGVKGYSGDGGLAYKAELNEPYCIALSKGGDLYFTEYGNMRVRKIDKKGVISTIAGNGKKGFDGDDGPATLASLNNPTGITLDEWGNIYIADSENDRIRKIDRSGNIRTIAGNGKRGFSGDGGLAENAQLNSPTGIAFDRSGNLFISDLNNNRIRRITKVGKQESAGDTVINISVLADPINMTLYFDFKEQSNFEIRLFDQKGILIDEKIVTGSHDATFDVKKFLSGLYSYSVKIKGRIKTGKFKLD